MVTDQVMKAPATPEVLAKTKGKEAAILKNIPDRTNKAKAPEMLVPKGTYPTEAATVAAFKDARAQTVALAKDTSKDLRAFASTGGPMSEIGRVPVAALPQRPHRAPHEADRGSEGDDGVPEVTGGAEAQKLRSAENLTERVNTHRRWRPALQPIRSPCA